MKTPQAMLLHWEKTASDHVLLRQPIKRRLHDFHWGEIMRQARIVATGLKENGVERGDRVAIFSKNCAHWLIADFAIMLAGAVSVPIYPTANARTLSYVIEHSHSKVCFVGTLDRPEELHDAIPDGVVDVVFPYGTMACNQRWDDWLEQWDPLEEVVEPDMDELMTILYTSGSTGNPKGAEHSYRSYAFAGQTIGEYLGIGDERVLSYLPLAHCTERAYVEAGTLYHNGCLYFAESLETFFEDLKIARPTMFGSVPRLWKRFQLGILAKTSQGKLDFLLRLPIIRGLVRNKIQAQLGLDQARWIASGTAPIAPALLHWWDRLGMPITEGWGMTESFAYGTQMPPEGPFRFGTIGKPLPGVELRIGANDEILMRSETMMVGYHREPEMTAASFEDGWLKTGDCGAIDEDGYVRITGRAKEIFKTGKGKYVAPVPIESLLAQNPLIELSCVMGLGMPQPVALIQLPPDGEVSRDQVSSALVTTLDAINPELESHERLDRLFVIADDWTPENGMLTPTLKLKRDVIEKHYAEAVSKGYRDRVVFLDAV